MELLRGVSAANNFVLAIVHIHLRGFFSSSITVHVAAASSATSATMCKYREGQAFKPSAARLLPSKAHHRLHELGDLTRVIHGCNRVRLL
jgi:hypothetical protein